MIIRLMIWCFFLVIWSISVNICNVNDSFDFAFTRLCCLKMQVVRLARPAKVISDLHGDYLPAKVISDLHAFNRLERADHSVGGNIQQAAQNRESGETPSIGPNAFSDEELDWCEQTSHFFGAGGASRLARAKPPSAISAHLPIESPARKLLPVALPLSM